MESNRKTSSTKNDTLSSIIDLSMKLENINKQIKACEEELEKWDRERLKLKREGDKLIESINHLTDTLKN